MQQILLELIGLMRDRERTKQAQQKSNSTVVNNIIINNK